MTDIVKLRKEMMESLEYNPDTGIMLWRGPRHRGEEAGVLDDGYRKISFKGKMYRRARLAWLFVTGSWPKHFIDHVNGARSDDRWANLRDVTNSENQQNLKKPRGASGAIGVLETKDGFRARIKINGVTHHLGTFATKEEAMQAYFAAKPKFHTFGLEKS